MRNIKGSYIKGYHQVPYQAEIPGQWEELDAKQFAAIIQVMHYRKADRHTVLVSLLALLFGKENWHILEGLNSKNPQENFLYELLPLTNFLTESTPPVKNFFPTLKIRKKICAAPADSLGNLSFGEWCFAFQFYQYYSLTGDPGWLDKLIAVLYRPIDPEQIPGTLNFTGDVREIFNENLIESRAKDVAHIESRFKLSVLAWFTVAVQELQKFRPNLFPEKEQTSEHDPQEVDGPQNNRTWLSVFRELLGPKWGTTEQLKNTNAMFVLDALEEQQIAYDEAMRATRS